MRDAITDLGKFEGEPVYVPFFWTLGLEGLATRDDGTWYEFDIDEDDRTMWPQLVDVTTLRLMERDDGFVIHEKVV